MEARGRRVGGGFPGYNGPALPRAMRSSRGRGEAARRQSNFGGRSGFFELLATVAGQFLNDDAVGEEQDEAKLGDPGTVKGMFSLEMDLQTSGIGNLANQGLPDKGQPASISSLVPCLDDLDNASKNEEGLRIDDEGGDKGYAVKDNNDFKHLVASQQEPIKAVVKDIPVDEGNSIPVQKTPPILGDREIALICDANRPSANSDRFSGSPSGKFKVQDSIPGSWGGSADMEQCPANESEESYTKEVVLEQVVDDKIQAALSSMVDEPANEMEVDGLFVGQEKSMLLTGQKSASNDTSKAKMEYSRALGELTDGWSPVQEATTRFLVNEPFSPISELRGYGYITESSEDTKVVIPLDMAETKEENSAGMDAEEQSIIVDTKDSPMGIISGSSKVASPGAVEIETTMPMLETPSKRDGKFSRKEKIKGNRSSQRLLPETMTIKLKDSHSKGMKACKIAKVVKRSRVSGMRSKRKHTDMESTDSGSSEDVIFGKKPFLGGIAAFTRQRTARGLPAKRMKIVDGTAKPSPDLHLDTTDLADMGYDCVAAKAASVASSPPAKGSKLCSKKYMEPHVKLSIKSFTVPELCVDLPESATVASLKRAVMDAAMNLLGEGLRVRVLLQGKKVPDEGATLSQMGISRSGKPESLGFMLEPSPLPTSPSATSEDPLLVLSRAANQPSPRYPVFGVSGVSGGEGGGRCSGKGWSNTGNGTAIDTDVVYGSPIAGDQQGYVEGKRSGITFSDTPDDLLKGCNGMKTKPHLNERLSISPHSTRVAAAGALAAIRAQADASRRPKNELDPPPTPPHNVGHNSLVGGSGAIIVRPSVGTGENLTGMALVPLRQKSRTLDIGKRRVRRPFSVAEVEALVHAVEKLGTGRWRDVKLRAFDQAKHRTYVDLKDKWKTLVHTARIAPHQRRGEPVPQELLERVTKAHAYWTAQAAKQQAELDF